MYLLKTTIGECGKFIEITSMLPREVIDTEFLNSLKK